MTADLDERIAAVLGAGRRSHRGRPRNGFQKARQYADEVWALRRAGVRSWRSIRDVAIKYQKTPQHISACVKMINDTLGHELWEADETEK